MSVYTRILAVPGIAMVVFATLIGRLPIGISGLAILLYVREVTGSFASAGIATGALALGSAVGAPFQGRLVDRRGLHMLLPLAFVHAVGLVLVWVLGAADAPIAFIVAATFVTGLAIPPLSSVLRSRWPFLLEDNPEMLKGAYALDSVLIGLVFIAGPLATTAIVAVSGPQFALAVSAGLVLSGTALLLSKLRGKPGPAGPQAGSSALGLGPLAAPGLRTLVLASLPVGFCFGSLEVVIPAFSDAEGSRELSGVLLAVWSASSAVAGLAYGARPPGTALTDLHIRFTLLLPLALIPLLAATSPLTMAFLVILAGIPVAPLVATRNQLVQVVTLPGTAMEAFTWPLMALVSGVSLGAAVAGALTEEYSWSAGVLAAIVVGSAGAALVVARRHTLAPPVAVQS